MHDKLIAYIENLLATRLPEEDIALIKSAFLPKTLRKHQYLLQEGEVCRTAGFVSKGALKQYTIDDSGKENILGLFIENWWVGDRESFFNDTPSPYYIDAFEPSELLVLTKEDYLQKLSTRPFMSELTRALSDKQAIRLLKRVHNANTLSAEQKLADLEKTYPEFLQRFPQHLIASYLGMTKETLSRIRSNAVKK